MDRRQFAKLLGLASLTGTCFEGANIREVLAQSQTTNKPLLTEQSLDNLFKGRDAPKLAVEAKKDMKAFLSNHFHLTDEQVKRIGWLTDEDWKRLSSVADEVAANRVKPMFRFTEPAGKAIREGKGANRITLVSATPASTTKAPGPTPTVTINVSNMWN